MRPVLPESAGVQPETWTGSERRRRRCHVRTGLRHRSVEGTDGRLRRPGVRNLREDSGTGGLLGRGCVTSCDPCERVRNRSVIKNDFFKKSDLYSQFPDSPEISVKLFGSEILDLLRTKLF